MTLNRPFKTVHDAGKMRNGAENMSNDAKHVSHYELRSGAPAHQPAFDARFAFAPLRLATA